MARGYEIGLDTTDAELWQAQAVEAIASRLSLLSEEEASE